MTKIQIVDNSVRQNKSHVPIKEEFTMSQISEDAFWLNYHHVKVGTFYLPPNHGVRELYCVPSNKVSTENHFFSWLKGKLNETGLIFKINDNGNILVNIPQDQKYGYILGWIAWTYRQTIQMEESV